MAFDLALSENGDLIVTGHRDLAGISGTSQLEQRIKARLKIKRGSWIYDSDGTFGSELDQLLGKSADEIQAAANVFVREALRGMNEIVVDQVRLDSDEKTLTVIVDYHLAAPNLPAGSQQFLTTSITVAQIEIATSEGGD